MPDQFDHHPEPAVSPDAAGSPNPETRRVGTTRADEEPLGSLFDDAYALYEDGKTYLEAEVAFQKSRAGYASRETGSGVVFAMAALAFLHLALIGLVVGLIIALAPIIGPFVATAAVVGTLLVLMVIVGLVARARFKRVSRAFKGDGS
ncbi:phage holin family protein [Citromicrobium bathyomarinum]|uniref:phage holin family protein n=1 Tax=Citromicrobium bathyomarinum TaxID=72174 RepID=UPI00315B20D1